MSFYRLLGENGFRSGIAMLSAIPEMLSQWYYVFALGFIFLWLVLMGIWYGRRLQAKEVVVITALSGIAVLSRTAFFWIPQCKPMAAIVLVSGSIFGGMSGMLVGILSAFLSNFIFGQGPWTPFQMLGFGLIGWVGGFVRTNHKWVAYLMGFFATVCLYGPIVNTASWLLMGGTGGLRGWWLIELAGLPYDVVHGVATVIFIYFTWLPMRHKLLRFRTKYGILGERKVGR